MNYDYECSTEDADVYVHEFDSRLVIQIANSKYEGGSVFFTESHVKDVENIIKTLQNWVDKSKVK